MTEKLTLALNDAIKGALTEIEETEPYEYQYLFILAGHLRGIVPGSRATDRRVATRFVPAAQEFGRRVIELGLAKGTMDWDKDAVELEFLKAWATRKLPKDSGLFELAVGISLKHNPLQLKDMNEWVIRIANLAFCLSEMIPESPILIPVNPRSAELLGCSPRTLSLALQDLIRERLVTVLSKPQSEGPMRRARRLKFNSKHPLVANDIDGARKKLKAALAEEIG